MLLNLEGGDDVPQGRNALEAKVACAHGVALLIEPVFERVRHRPRLRMPDSRTDRSRPAYREAFHTLGTGGGIESIPISQRALDPGVGNCREAREAGAALPLQLSEEEGGKWILPN